VHTFLRPALSLTAALALTVAVPVVGAASATASPRVAAVPATDGSPDTGVVYVKRYGAGNCAANSKTVYGTLNGSDGRDVNALIGLDMFNGANKKINGYGCVGVPGYGVTVPAPGWTRPPLMPRPPSPPGPRRCPPTSRT
jgi:hypothetical protein